MNFLPSNIIIQGMDYKECPLGVQAASENRQVYYAVGLRIHKYKKT